MKNLKKLLCLLMAVCLVASFAFAAFAVDVETENDREILDMTHIDVKESAKYYAEIDGESVVLDAVVVPETIVVTVATPNANLVYDFGNYDVLTITEKGMTEYRIVLDGTDGALLNAIDWAGASFYMNNVYVSTRLVFAEVPAALAAEMEQDENGNYFVDVSFRYTGIQECTGHNGLRSEGNHGAIVGVDLYLDCVPGMSVETPEPTVPSEPEETTEPTCPDPSCPTCPTCPDPSCPTEEPEDPSEPEETTAPSEPEETTVPTEPEETTVPSEPEETTVPSEPEETTEPTEPSEEETTEPSEPETDDVPDTGDNSKLLPLMILMGISAVGMGTTAIIGKKLKYVGKWE